MPFVMLLHVLADRRVALEAAREGLNEEGKTTPPKHTRRLAETPL